MPLTSTQSALGLCLLSGSQCSWPQSLFQVREFVKGLIRLSRGPVGTVLTCPLSKMLEMSCHIHRYVHLPHMRGTLGALLTLPLFLYAHTNSTWACCLLSQPCQPRGPREEVLAQAQREESTTPAPCTGWLAIVWGHLPLSSFSFCRRTKQS